MAEKLVSMLQLNETAVQRSLYIWLAVQLLLQFFSHTHTNELCHLANTDSPEFM